MKTPNKISSIAAMHHLLKLKKPLHPLISVFDFADITVVPEDMLHATTIDLYIIGIKKDCAGKCRYGQQHSDFDDGIMYFIAPNQVLKFEEISPSPVEGWVLAVHPDFIQGYPLAKHIKEYGYFSYSGNEALFLSEKEEHLIMDILEHINRELETNTDDFTQDLLITNIELLLKYCDRFYHRQFLTRKKPSTDLLTKLEELLDDYFSKNISISGLPTVQYIAEALHLSPNYLSDMLRVHTGQTTQQHIQNKLIEKAKILLSTTERSVSEIAYHLGFEHSQSFHRLFKNRTSVSPSQFRQSLN
ncbi:MAG: helix-turn-helix transcriptional regulator [Arachidicoccus sp.]|nr:helix-turn-helix transcriptional regulator [Arachidicoccus sp.]